VEALLPSMACVVVVLLRQCDDELEVGFPWISMDISSGQARV
jgi:hypothetical protein